MIHRMVTWRIVGYGMKCLHVERNKTMAPSGVLLYRKMMRTHQETRAECTVSLHQGTRDAHSDPAS
jgi:hypothetical protein